MGNTKNIIQITGIIDGVNPETIKAVLKEAGVAGNMKIETLPNYDDWLESLPKEDLPGLREECINWIRCWCNGGGDYSSKNVITEALEEMTSDVPKKLAEAAYDSVIDYSKKEFEAIGLVMELINGSIEDLALGESEGTE